MAINLSVNGTLIFNEPKAINLALKPVSDILATIFVILVMFSMGANVNIKQIIAHLQLPIGVAIGMFCQFIIMPLVGFLLVHLFQLSGPTTLGILLMSCCPGGAISNIITYWLDGDVPLSVTMTTISTIMSLGLMPFNFWLYGHWIKTENMVVPYKDITISLICVSIPLALGILLRLKFPNFSNYITKIGNIMGFSLIITLNILLNFTFPLLFSITNWQYFVIAVIMPISGFVLTYGLARICKRTIAISKTIGIESGVQSVAVAFGVLSLTPMDTEEKRLMFTFPMLYGLSMSTLAIVLAICNYAYKHIIKRHN